MTGGNTADFTTEQLEKLEKHNIQVVETEIAEVEHSEEGMVQNMVFQDGSKLPFNVVYGVIPFMQHSTIPVSLGCELTEHGHLKIDPFQKTNIPGVFACGDCTTMLRTVSNAVHSGNIAGVMANIALTEDNF